MWEPHMGYKYCGRGSDGGRVNRALCVVDVNWGSKESHHSGHTYQRLYAH